MSTGCVIFFFDKHAPTQFVDVHSPLLRIQMLSQISKSELRDVVPDAYQSHTEDACWPSAMDDPLSHPLEASDKKKQSNKVHTYACFSFVCLRNWTSSGKTICTHSSQRSSGQPVRPQNHAAVTHHPTMCGSDLLKILRLPVDSKRIPFVELLHFTS